ncbi:glycosyl transferase [Kocuria dechangensis]|uniref:D-inositol 3-phosphate glycosyltransferase n=1 Tax=Kocuria dechangensis TaxID=1176249 RepID=A0A917GN55_9MICC|nr:glycosyltransferase family 4 protein [Kocuria dechangensis]GGG52376.1 glycosyl transferase [Kocuria dechangensis]
MSTCGDGAGVLEVVMPDDGRPTGGSLYDLRLVAALRGLGRAARTVPVAGSWPHPDAAARARLRAALGEPAPGRTVLLDGLVGCAAPEVVDDAVRCGVPVHVLLHLPLPAETGLGPAEAQELGRREAAALAAATGVVVTSSWAARDLRRRYGTEGAAVAVPGTRPVPVAGGSAPPRLSCVGSLTPLKNQVLLLEALAPLVRLDWTLDLVGAPGPAGYVRTLQEAVEAFPDPARVRRTGPLTGAALEAQWEATDLLVLSSTAETYGMVVAEALAHGIPAVVPAGTGAVEALDGAPDGTGAARDRAGAALDSADPAAWTAVLHEWLTDPALRERWRRRALVRRAGLRTWEDTARDVLAALRPPVPAAGPHAPHTDPPSDTRRL